jgi:hypothetical protein
MKNISSSLVRWLRSIRPALSLLALASSSLCCFGQLPVDLDLPPETLDSGYIVYQASNSITNGGNLLVQAPATVTLKAGNYIRLEPGFHAIAGATFYAVIDPNVVNWQPIPVPDPPAPCTDCGLDFLLGGNQAVDLYAPSSSNQLYAYCWAYDGVVVVVVPCNISLSPSSYEFTNCHLHNDPPAPFSSISPDSGYTGNYWNLAMPVTLTTTQVGQLETVYITGDADYDYYYFYAVGYRGLVYIDNSNVFYQTGGNTTDHGDNYCNHWMTVNAATGLQSAATFYINSYNPGRKICINDMALPIGGKFDINDNWQSPHVSHDQGTAADVAARAGQCPANYTVNLSNFRQACLFAGSSAANTITEGNHVHCRWPY